MDSWRIKIRASPETKTEITNFNFRKRAKNIYLFWLIFINCSGNASRIARIHKAWLLLCTVACTCEVCVFKNIHVQRIFESLTASYFYLFMLNCLKTSLNLSWESKPSDFIFWSDLDYTWGWKGRFQRTILGNKTVENKHCLKTFIVVWIVGNHPCYYELLYIICFHNNNSCRAIIFWVTVS